MLLRIALMFFFFLVHAAGATFYVDGRAGSDSNNGTSRATAWKTLAKVRSQGFKPGDIIQLAGGSTYTGGLTLDDNGSEASPITFQGEPGAGQPPEISGQAVVISGDYNIVENLRIKGVHGEGIRIQAGAIHNVVRNCEIHECGAGVWVSGTDNLITRNHIHDLNIVVNTPGGDDDNGAVGVWMAASRVEVSYNRFVNCKAPSYDYKYDGGAVEWWAQNPLEGNHIHHNFATGCEGFMESGGRGALISNARVEYNVSLNNGWFALLNTRGQYAVKLENFVMENNTVVQVGPHIGWGATASIHFFDPDPKSVILRNNIFHLDGWKVCDNATVKHDHNLFWFTRNGAPGFPLDPTDKRADPLFADLTGGNFQLLPGSPAIDMGVKPVVAATDFLGKPMAGTAPDAGAYEHQAGFTSLTRSGSPASPVAGRRTTELRILSVSARGSAFDLVGRNLPKRERKP